MRVAGIAGGGGVTRAAAAKGAAAGAAFRVQSAAEPSAAAGPTQLRGADSVGALLALQAEPDALHSRRRRAARAGHDVLDRLNSLRIAMIEGSQSGPGADLLEGMLGQITWSGDSGLDEALAAIDLRARVELAKLGRFPA